MQIRCFNLIERCFINKIRQYLPQTIHLISNKVTLLALNRLPKRQTPFINNNKIQSEQLGAQTTGKLFNSLYSNHKTDIQWRMVLRFNQCSQFTVQRFYLKQLSAWFAESWHVKTWTNWIKGNWHLQTHVLRYLPICICFHQTSFVIAEAVVQLPDLIGLILICNMWYRKHSQCM